MEYRGLTSAEVRERAAKGLQNRVKETKSKKVREILIENIFSVFNFIILIIMIFVFIFYLKTYDNRLLLDSIGIVSVAIINTLIAIVQEIRAKKALDKVSLLLKKEVKVIRDGKEISIEQSDIVVDEIIMIERGDQIAVDGKVIKANHLEIDESLLTGESVPAEKSQNDKILSGSFCVSGNGLYIAEKVGDESYASEITKMAKRFKLILSPLQVKINLIVKGLFASAVILILMRITLRTSDFGQVEFIREIATIAISLVPQGLVLMSSVTFALGIYRISKIGAIVQKLNAIESFSNVKVVCTDKTGTLTKNMLAVQKITLLNNKFSQEETEELLGTYSRLSSDKNATLRTLELFKAPAHPEAEDRKINVIDEIPFSSEKKRSVLQLRVENYELRIILGAHDILIEKAAEKYKGAAEKLYRENGLEIYRNLLFGIMHTDMPFCNLKDDIPEGSIEPLCIVSITDKVRDDVMDAINLFHKNHIEVKILSGDSAPAIQAVAREIGWNVRDEELISGDELEKITDNNLAGIVSDKTIFARLKPEHKLRIIKAFRKEKIYTAMIGDGVNDLPAIKEADMGIAMEEGSGITKEVADIVLLKNKFSLLPKIFDEGNKIINTVNSVAKLFLTKNFIVIYATVLSLLFLLEFPFTPRRVALINLFSIALPSLMIALKNTDTGKTINFMKDLFSFVILSAAIITAAGYTGQYFTSSREGPVSEQDLHMVMVSIMIFITTANFYAVIIKKSEQNKKLYFIYGIALISIYIFLSLTRIDFIILNFIKSFYEITYLKPEFWGIVAIISIISSAVLIIVQLLRSKYFFQTPQE